MVRRRRIAIALSVAVGSVGVGPATTPTACPPGPPIGRWVAELADSDPATRDAAAESLMGLTPAQLPDLQNAVRTARPLRPDQVIALPEIVRQILLAGDAYAVGGSGGGPKLILGQSWPTGWSDWRAGVAVVDRWPGFPARRAFRDGDLILGLYTDPTTPADQPPDLPTPTANHLINAMQASPTPVVSVAVLRDGSVRRLTIAMVPEPAQTVGRHDAATTAFLQDRDRRAASYWAEQFAPLISPPSDPTPRSTVELLDGGS